MIEYPVVNAIYKRIETESSPFKRKDNFKIGLVIEGGAMRGVVSGGMVMALEKLNTLSAFDAIYSVSAGACAGAYFLTGQAKEGTSIYFEDINNERFINFKRLLKNQPVIDIPYLAYKVMKDRKTLRWEKAAGIPFHVYTTSALDAQIVDLTDFKNQDRVLDALHWTCRVPVVAGMPVKVSEKLYYSDGGILAGGIPLQQAVQDQCTHILVLITRPEGTILKGVSLREYIIKTILKKKGFTVLADHFWEGYQWYTKALKTIQIAKENPQEITYALEAIQLPKGTTEIPRLEKRKEVLIQGAKDGYQAVIAKFKI